MKHLLRTLCLGLFSVGLGFAQPEAPNLPIQTYLGTNAIEAGGESMVGVQFTVPARHHITDVEYGLFYIDIPDTLGFSFGEPVFPPDEPLIEEQAYRGKVLVRIPVTASADVAPGTYSWQFMVGYQICQEFGQEVCFLPEDKRISVTIDVVSAGSGVIAANAEVFGGEVAAVEAELTLDQRLIKALEKGSWIAFLLVFFGGILTSFTPCVYPVIPITIGYIGGASGGKPLRGLMLASVFSLGIALIYSTLGLISAATGSLFGAISGSPVLTVAMIIIFALMGFSMLGAFEIAIPASLQSKISGPGRAKGLLGPLLMGMASGLIMAPCVGPIIVVLLAWVAKSGNLLYGWSLLFVFSFGLSLLFLVLGTSASAIQALPRAGSWMETVKKSFGWILLAGALYLGRLLIPEPFNTLAWGIFLIIFAVFAGIFDTLKEGAGAGARIWKALMVVVLIVGAISIYKVMVPQTGGPVSAVQQEIEWSVNNEKAAIAQSLREGKPLLIDVYADWCVACVELDEKTYVVPEVINRTRNMVRLKLDFTKTTPWVEEMKQKYKITGMPTVILYDGTGSELERFTGFKSADEFLAFLSKHNL